MSAELALGLAVFAEVFCSLFLLIALDHGTWAVIRHMYPETNIPVLQLSIDYTKGPQYHYYLAKELYALRKKGVLVIGSRNMVHNLRLVAWGKMGESEYGYDWQYR